MDGTTVVSVTIPPNEKSSSGADLGSMDLIAIEMPETFNGTTFTFQSKAKRKQDEEGGAEQEDWDDVYDSAGNQITWTVAKDRVVVPTAAHAAALAPLKHIRIVAATDQGAERILRFICKR